MHLDKIAMPTKANITGLILAGGRGQRFNNEDKGLIAYKDSTLAEHALARLTPQTNSLLISANRHFEFYEGIGATLIKDEIKDYAGPLAGIHAALNTIETEWLATIACDTPCFPIDYVSQLANAIEKSKTLVAVASSQNRLQNISMLVHKSLYPSLNAFLNAGERKVQIWLEKNNPVIVDFNNPKHAFYNINTPEDLIAFEKLNCDV